MSPDPPVDTQIGESFVGDGSEAAHLSTVPGAKGGPVEVAWATVLATPRQEDAAFIVEVGPGLPVKPMTLFVNKAEIAGSEHSRLTWGAAQAGVASGVRWAVADGIIPAGLVDDVVLITADWVNPEALDEEVAFVNNRAATHHAPEAGSRWLPTIEDLLAVRDAPRNPYFEPQGSG